MDLREILSEDIYPVYIDGVGWANVGSRNDGYCPICNPKSYFEWEQKILIQRQSKLANELLIQSQQEMELINLENDRKQVLFPHLKVIISLMKILNAVRKFKHI